jgi:hypothetical protein
MGGLFVGRRFVRFPHSSVLTVFGYHFPDPTAEMKKLIDRNQTISSVHEEVIFDALRDVFQSDKLVAKVLRLLPNGSVHELSGLIPKDRWQSRAGVVSGAASSPRAGLDARPVSGATCAPRAAEKRLPAVEAEARPHSFSFSVAHVRDVVETAREGTRSIWAEHGVAVLNELNKWARKAFPKASVQVVPYGSVVYEVSTVHFCLVCWARKTPLTLTARPSRRADSPGGNGAVRRGRDTDGLSKRRRRARVCA